MQPGQLLLRPMLVTQSQTTSGLAIPHGMVAVSILFCVPEAVAGNVHAGSQVAVFDTIASGSATMTAQPACTGPHQWLAGDTASTKLVLPKVTVLAVGQALRRHLGEQFRRRARRELGQQPEHPAGDHGGQPDRRRAADPDDCRTACPTWPW